MTDTLPQSIFRGDQYDFKFFLERILGQIRLSIERNAALVCGAEVVETIRVVDRILRSEIGADAKIVMGGGPILAISPDEMAIYGFNWDCKNLDEFATVRESKDVDEFAKEFRTHLSSSEAPATRLRKTLTAMKKAMDSSFIARRYKGFFETTGDYSKIAHLLPFVNIPAALTGLTSILGVKRNERQDVAAQWYMMGSKIQEISLQERLKSLTVDE